jgi:hypothetical protein
MKKLTLDVEQLEVHSFEIAEESKERGTVHGAMMATGYWFCFGSLVCSAVCP